MIVMIDNYDSFTYNLVQYFLELGEDVTVFRNDEVSIGALATMAASHIVISPGPGRPENAGISEDVIRQFAGRTPILGVCLGHQAIGRVFGAKVVHAPTLVHGKTSPIFHQGQGVFAGLPSPFKATRYHSLLVDRQQLPDVLTVTASTEDGLIMGLSHRDFSVHGIQFHPESILTEFGKDMLKNFLKESNGTPR